MARKLPQITSPPAGLGRDGLAGSTDPAKGAVRVVATDRQLDGKLVVERRHVDWLEHQIRWRWLLDSYEGGDRYRNAVYGPDRKGLPCRNLFRHRREYPDPQQYPTVYQGFAGFMGMVNTQTQDVGYGPYPGMLGADPAATAMDDDYELRRSRTPVPEFVAEAVEIHLGKVYAQEVARDGPADLVKWWEDVDGRGTPIDDWMRETVAPLLLVLGCLDICLDHPKAPPGVEAGHPSRRAGRRHSTGASRRTSCRSTWSGGGPTPPAGTSSAWSASTRTRPTGSTWTHKGNAIDIEDAGQVGSEWRKNYVRYRLWRSDESILYSLRR